MITANPQSTKSPEAQLYNSVQESSVMGDNYTICNDESDNDGTMERARKEIVEDANGDSHCDSSVSKAASNTRPRGSRKGVRRAALACLCCRQRKVRCDAIDRVPCGNCRWAKTECILQRGRRRRSPGSKGKTHFQDFAIKELPSPSPSPYPKLPTNTCTIQHLEPSAQWRIDGQLPPFIRPLPRSIDVEDAEYLVDKGVLALPTISLQNALLQSYAEHVHPSLPVLDLHEFLTIVDRRDGATGQISLLLYQAVMAAATAFVDDIHLHKAGYLTRWAASQALFRNVKLLYDFKYEPQGLVLVQALLLMSCSAGETDGQLDRWHWTDSSLSAAYAIGLNRKDEAERVPVTQKALWRRVWWCCFMRDRLITLGTQRPLRIKQGDFDVPMLSIQDFDLQQLSPSNATIPGQHAILKDMVAQEELAVICIAKVQLCFYIGCVFGAHDGPDARNFHKMQSSVDRKKADKRLEALGSQLKSWHASLPECCQCKAPTWADIGGNRVTVTIHRTLLHMIYHATIISLHQPQMHFSAHQIFTAPTLNEYDQQRPSARNASLQIISMAENFCRIGLERFLPQTSLMAIVLATVHRLREAKDAMQDNSENSVDGLKQGIQVLKSLGRVHRIAEYAVGILNTAVSNCNAPSTAKFTKECATISEDGSVSKYRSSESFGLDLKDFPNTMGDDSLKVFESPYTLRKEAQSTLASTPADLATLDLSGLYTPPSTGQGWVEMDPSMSRGTEHSIMTGFDDQDLDFMSCQYDLDGDHLTGPSSVASPLNLVEWMPTTVGDGVDHL